MGGEIARRGDEDRRCLWVALPGEILPHGGLQVLHHMEAGVLAQQRIAQQCNEIGGWIAGGKMTSCQPPGLRNLLLAVAGIEECAAKLGGRRDYIIFARQPRWRDIQIAIEIDSERAMEGSAQA